MPNNELPKNIEAEQAVLGAVLIDENLIVSVSDGLNEDDFYDLKHKVIFRAMNSLMKKESHIDVTTLISCIKDQGSLNESGGEDYLLNIMANAYSVHNIDSYMALVSDASLKRKTISLLNQMMEKGFDSSLVAFDYLENVEKEVFRLSSKRKVGDFVAVSTLSETVLDNINQRFNMTSEITGLDTGFPLLNNLTNGFQNGALLILAARPAMGKSAMALNLAYNVARFNRNGKASVAVFSLEMTSEQLVERMVSSISQIPLKNISTGKFQNPNQDIALVTKAARDKLSRCNIYFDDNANITIANMRAKCRKLKSEDKLDFVVVDYLQLITDDSGRKSTQEEVARISRGLKLMAKELNVPVLALSQLSRSVEQRKDANGGVNKRPQLSDLRDSGSIEQDADIVMFLYREDYYDKNSPRKGEADLIVAKNRSGATSNGIAFNFRGEIVNFTPISYQESFKE